jgi:DNA-binding NarL/FixJ family response regulator
LNGVANLKILSPGTRIIILSDTLSEDMEWELLKAGTRGYCRPEISSELLKHVVMAVQQGELWVRRTLTSRLADELGETTIRNNVYRASHGFLNNLTQREYDIAMYVADGMSNKEIAQVCAITERTVKAHLSEVFHKLGVSDRLNLALIISANDPEQARAGLGNYRSMAASHF